MLRDEEALRDLVGAEMLVEEEQDLDLAGGELGGDRIGNAEVRVPPSRTRSSRRRATSPERAASPWATPFRNSAIRSGGSVFNR